MNEEKSKKEEINIESWLKKTKNKSKMILGTLVILFVVSVPFFNDYQIQVPIFPTVIFSILMMYGFMDFNWRETVLRSYIKWEKTDKKQPFTYETVRKGVEGKLNSQ